jgi:hypothetical protein
MEREMVLMGEAGFEGDLTDGHCPLSQQHSSAFHTTVNHILVNWLAN